MELNLALFRFATTLYLIGTVAYLLYLFIPKKWVYRSASLTLLTGFILGPLFALLVYSVYVTTQVPEAVNLYFEGPVLAFIAVAIVAAIAQLIVLLWRLTFLRSTQMDELYGSTYLLIHRFKFAFYSRMGLLIAGAMILPTLILHHLQRSVLSQSEFVVMASLSFVLALVGEFVGRYLFFVTVVPKNMPGSFFTKGRGAH